MEEEHHRLKSALGCVSYLEGIPIIWDPMGYTLED